MSQALARRSVKALICALVLVGVGGLALPSADASLTVNLRWTDGSVAPKTVAVGQELTIDVWATVMGSDTSTSNDGLASAAFSIISQSSAPGTGIHTVFPLRTHTVNYTDIDGNLQVAVVQDSPKLQGYAKDGVFDFDGVKVPGLFADTDPGWFGLASQLGKIQDLNADGAQDIGTGSGALTADTINARSRIAPGIYKRASIPIGVGLANTIAGTPAGYEFKLYSATFVVQDLGVGGTLAFNPVLPAVASVPAQWGEDTSTATANKSPVNATYAAGTGLMVQATGGGPTPPGPESNEVGNVRNQPSDPLLQHPDAEPFIVNVLAGTVPGAYLSEIQPVPNIGGGSLRIHGLTNLSGPMIVMLWLQDTVAGGQTIDSLLAALETKGAGKYAVVSGPTDPDQGTNPIESWNALQMAYPGFNAYVKFTSPGAPEAGTGDFFYNFNLTASPADVVLNQIAVVPEPGTLALLGLMGLAALRRRRA